MRYELECGHSLEMSAARYRSGRYACPSCFAERSISVASPTSRRQRPNARNPLSGSEEGVSREVTVAERQRTRNLHDYRSEVRASRSVRTSMDTQMGTEAPTDSP